MKNRREPPYRPAYFPLKRRGTHASVPRLRPLVVLRPSPSALAAPTTTLSNSMGHPSWFQGRNLDFCLLAVCSCTLAVLCHQNVYLSPSPGSAPATVTASSGTASSRIMLSQLDFVLKAGLFTTQQQSEEDEELDE